MAELRLPGAIGFAGKRPKTTPPRIVRATQFCASGKQISAAHDQDRNTKES